MSSGQMVSFFYVTLFILVPTIGAFLFGQASWSIYYHQPPPPWALMLIFLLWLISASPLMRISRMRAPRPNRYLHKLTVFLERHTLKLAVLVAGMAGLLYSPSAAAFRYAGNGISSGGLDLIIVLILKAVASVALMWLMVRYVRQGFRISQSHRIAIWVLTAMLFYTVNGTADFLTAVFFLIFAISPKIFTGLVFLPKSKSLFSLRALLHLASPILIMGMFLLAIMVGDSVKETGKVGFDARFIDFSVVWLIVRIVDGISSHYFAFAQFFDGRVSHMLTQYDYPLVYPLQAVEYRAGQLLGLDVARPDIQSLSRLNFLVNSFKFSFTEGTSPGLFASFAYLLPLPLALPVALLYMRWVISVIDRFLNLPGYKLSLFGGVFMLLQFLFVYQSPPDFLVLFDNSVVALALVWLLARMGEDSRIRQSRMQEVDQTFDPLLAKA